MEGLHMKLRLMVLVGMVGCGPAYGVEIEAAGSFEQANDHESPYASPVSDTFPTCGCVANGVCEPGDSRLACGSDGQDCMQCAHGCSRGACIQECHAPTAECSEITAACVGGFARYDFGAVSYAILTTVHASLVIDPMNTPAGKITSVEVPKGFMGTTVIVPCSISSPFGAVTGSFVKFVVTP